MYLLWLFAHLVCINMYIKLKTFQFKLLENTQFYTAYAQTNAYCSANITKFQEGYLECSPWICCRINFLIPKMEM